MKRNRTRVKVMLIGPRTAKKLLANPWGDQRKLKPAWVAKLASDLKAGHFHVGPDAITIVCGKLANGQHRLKAVADSGVPAKFLVLYTSDPELYKVIDCGRKRTAADSLTKFQYYRLLPAIANWVLAYDSGQVTPGAKSGADATYRRNKSRQQTGFTQLELINYCEEHNGQLQQASAMVYRDYIKTKLLVPSIAGAVCYLAIRSGKTEQVSEFLRQLYVEGGQGSAGDLRNKMIANLRARARLPLGYLFGLTVKAFSNFCNGNHEAVLRWRENETLPKI